MNNDPSLLRKLEQKETQERQLTEEWTEKWKEAAQVRPHTLIRKKLGFEVRKENRDLRDSFSNITKGKDLSKKKVPLFYYPCSFSLSICLATPKSYMPMFPK